MKLYGSDVLLQGAWLTGEFQLFLLCNPLPCLCGNWASHAHDWAWQAYYVSGNHLAWGLPRGFPDIFLGNSPSSYSPTFLPQILELQHGWVASLSFSCFLSLYRYFPIKSLAYLILCYLLLEAPKLIYAPQLVTRKVRAIHASYVVETGSVHIPFYLIFIIIEWYYLLPFYIWGNWGFT